MKENIKIALAGDDDDCKTALLGFGGDNDTDKIKILADLVVDWAESLQKNGVLIYGEDPSSDAFVDDSLEQVKNILAAYNAASSIGGCDD
jgi:hypothetical protein